MMKSTDRFISSEARQESKAVMINSIISGVDKVAIEMERKWGINRLRMLVPDADREKFDRQTANFDMVIGTSDTNEIRLHADSMKLAWAALDEIANAAGAEILKPDIWEIRLPGSGDIVAFVRTEAEAYRLARDGQEAYTAADIAAAIEGLGKTSRHIKRMWPGAKVERVEVKPPPTDWQRGDDLPLNFAAN
jgi:hypothetical protein